MNFDTYQQRAINSFDENVALMATAGSGKTTVLVERASQLVEKHGVDPSRILFLCFDNTAKDNMVAKMAQRNPDLGKVNIMTVHALAKRMMERHTDYGLVVRTYDTRAGEIGYLSIMQRISNKYKFMLEQNHPCVESLMCQFVARELRQLHTVDELDYDEFDSYFMDMVLKQIFEQYLAELDKQRIITFDTAVYKAVELLNDSRILKDEQSYFDYIFVDEAQDLSHDKYVLITTLAKDKNLFMVGDTLQAIYGFAGGDCSLLREHHKNFDNVTVLNLPTNYRCSANIIDAANAVASFSIESLSEHYMEAVANNKAYKMPVHHIAYDEAQTTINVLRQLGDYPNTAVLFRTNAQMYRMMSRLFSAGVPYKCEKDENGKLPREVTILTAYFKLILNHDDNEAFKSCMNQPPRYIKTAVADRLAKESKSIYEGAKKSKSSDKSVATLKMISKTIDEILAIKSTNAVKAMAKLYELMRAKELAQRLSNGSEMRKEAILDLYVQFKEEAAEFKNIKEYARHFLDVVAIQSNAENGVRLMTVHKSKGMEFENVVIPYFNKGTFPHKRTTNEEEEKKLLYVAITRAKKELHFVSDVDNESLYSSYFGDTVKRYIEEMETT